MNHSATHKKFVFSGKIDNEFLFSLYEADYSYILEVFTSTLDELDSSIAGLASARHSGNCAGLRKIVHKMKPLFGFCGLLFIQDAVAEFEGHCGNAVVEIPESAYQSLIVLVNEARNIIISEQKRLQEFIKA